jgi:regulator of sigma E protease
MDLIALARAIFPFGAILIALVVIHEAGHFVAAKALGVKVLEFGVGFPPRIKGLVWRRGETDYTLNWLPIGGFVRLLGEEDPSDPRSLAAAARWKRLTIMSAGVVMNLVVAIILFSVGFMIPRDRSLALSQVIAVSLDSPAAEAQIVGEMTDGSAPLQGLQPGDIIIEVEGTEVMNTGELIYENRLNLGKTQEWLIKRSGSELTAFVYARWHPPADQGPTGIQVGAPQFCSGADAEGNPTGCQLLYPFVESVSYWPWEALPKGIDQLQDTVVLTMNEIRVRVGGGGGAGVSSEQPLFSGPVGIADTTGQIIDQAGWRPLLELAALLSLSLAVFNALPMPALDGGRIAFVLLEYARGGRRVAPEKEALVHFVGMAILLSLFVVITFRDFQRIFS